MRHPDRLAGICLAARRRLPEAELRRSFGQPQSAIDALTTDLQLLWDHHRTDDFSERRIGTLELTSGAYVQWIGYSDALAVECSSNAFLDGPSRLTPPQEASLLRAGFQGPDDEEPNFWLVVADRDACSAAAFTIVAALTTAFGVYAG